MRQVADEGLGLPKTVGGRTHEDPEMGRAESAPL